MLSFGDNIYSVTRHFPTSHFFLMSCCCCCYRSSCVWAVALLNNDIRSYLQVWFNWCLLKYNVFDMLGICGRKHPLQSVNFLQKNRWYSTVSVRESQSGQAAVGITPMRLRWLLRGTWSNLSWKIKDWSPLFNAFKFEKYLPFHLTFWNAVCSIRQF